MQMFSLGGGRGIIALSLILVITLFFITCNHSDGLVYTENGDVKTTYSYLDQSDCLSVEMSDKTIIVNGESFPLSNRWAIVVFSESWKINTDGSSGAFLAEYTDGVYKKNKLSSGDKIEASGGLVTINISGETHTLHYDVLGYYDPNGGFGTTGTSNKSVPMDVNANSDAVLVSANTSCTTLVELSDPSSCKASARVYTEHQLGSYWPVTWDVDEKDGLYTVSSATLNFDSSNVVLYVIAPIHTFSLNMPLNSEEWTYGDYRMVDGVESASGSLELVDVAGVKMLHASDVGAGKWVDSKGEHQVFVSRAHLDVVLYTGQSNSTYIASNSHETFATPTPRIGTAWVWATNDGNYSNLNESKNPLMLPMVSSEGVLQTASQAPAFAAEYTKVSGHKVLIVGGGVSGRNVQSFMPDSMPTWKYMADVMTDALSSIDRNHFIVHSCSYVWIQGEANSTTPIDVYKDNFLAMHEAITSGDLGICFDYCVMGLPPSKNAGSSIIAQRELASEYSDIIIGFDVGDSFSIDNGMMVSDGLHFSQYGCNVIGSELGKVCGTLVVKSEKSLLTLNDTPTDDIKRESLFMGTIPSIILIGIVSSILAVGLYRRHL